MKVAAPHLALTDDEVVLRSDIHTESSTFPARIGIDRRYVGFVNPGPDPFVPAATIGAAATGENLEVADRFSPELRDGTQRAATLYNEWWGHKAIVVRGPTEKPPFPAGPGRGLFFTRGVDSMFSLLQSTTGAIEPFTHLIGVAEIDHWVSPASRASTWDDTAAFAHELGIPIVRVTTNLREFLDPRAEWVRTHGAVLASLAVSLSPLFHSVVISSTQKDVHELPHGSHSELDPQWSTEQTSIQHVGTGFGRHEKAIRLAERPDLLQHLKVCWIGDLSGNCGRCEKCLRTMTALAIAGREASAPFDARLSPEAVERVSLSERIAREVRDEMVPDIPAGLSELRDAWVRTVEASLDGRAQCDVPPDAPIRLPRSAAHAILSGAVQEHDRPVAWCLVDEQSAAAVALADRLTEVWGPGLCYISGVAWGDGQPPGLTSVERILQAARVRVWWSDEDELDSGRLAQSVLSGCAPIQMLLPDSAERLRRRIPRRLHDCVVGFDASTPLDLPDASRTADMIRHVVLELVAGSLSHGSEPAVADTAGLRRRNGG